MSARKVMPPKAVKNQYMQVYVRCRPICENEVNQRNTSVIEVQGLKDICVQDRCNAKVTKTYSFDKVFNSNTGQADIYDTVVSPMISDVLSGFDCTVFAYGQTGSGKTFTMEGELCTGVSRDSKAGLIPRAMCALFDELLVLQSESSVRISFMELYNEELYDLLSPDEVPPKLRLFDDPTKKGSVVVQGLQEVMVHTLSQVMNELQKGSAKRQVAATIMNAQSSRSHTIFCVNVHFKENSVDGEELLRTGKLYLVDLAGSENIGRSGAVEKRVREAANINQSLLTLGRVTSCLVERQPHIPYRESKLTRLLQDSLGGKTKTSMIATISLAQSNVEETLSTLDYALRAKSVANKPEVNQKVSQVVILKEYMDVISNLKKKLEMSRNGSGVYVNYDNYRQMMDQKQELHQTRLDLISEMRAVAASKKSIEETCSDLKIKLVSENHNLQNVTNTIAQTSEEIHRASDNLEKASKKQGEADYLLKTLEHQEAQVRTQAEHLMSIADSVQEDSDKIHKRLDQSRFILEENKAALSKASLVKYHKMVLTKMQESVSVCKRLLMERGSALDSLTTEITKDGSNAINRVSSFEENLTSLLRHLQSILDKYQEDKENLGENISAKLSTFHSQFDRDLEQFERSLHDACMTFEQYLTHFPDLRDSLLDSVLTSIQSVQNTTKTELYKIKEDLNLIRMQWNNAVENTNKSMEHGISVDFKNLRPHIQEKCAELSDVGARLQKSLQGIVARRTETEQGREEKSMKVSKLQENIIADMTNAIERREESLPKYQAVYQTLLKNRELDSDRVLSIQDSVLEAVKKAKNLQSDTMTLCENVKSCDYESTFDQVLQEYNSAQSQSRSQLQSAVNQSHVMMKTSGELCQNLSADFKDMRLKREHFVDVADNAHRIFLEGNENTSTVALNDLENQKALVNKILSSEISYDVPTGETPIKKIYGPISEKVCISSPIVKKVKPIIKKGTWRRLLRSPRRPLTSAKSFGDCEDDLMVSDSEVASIKRIRQTHSLQKASSLSDLRSSKVFQRPRVPKKNINFV